MSKVLLAGGVVAVLILAAAAVVGQVGATGQYHAQVWSDWAKLSDGLAQLDASIAAKPSFDFGETAKAADALRRLVDERALYYRNSSAPRACRLFNAYLLDYMGKASTALTAINTNCSTWSEVETGKLKSSTTTLCDSSRYCATAWRGQRPLTYKADLFQNVPAVFNQMHAARKPAPPPPFSSQVVLVHDAPVIQHQISGDFVLPDSGWRDLSVEEVAGLSQWQLGVARNEIYARHGRIFQKPQYAEYFRSKSWYCPRSGFSDSELSETERRNVALIQNYER